MNADELDGKKIGIDEWPSCQANKYFLLSSGILVDISNRASTTLSSKMLLPKTTPSFISAKTSKLNITEAKIIAVGNFKNIRFQNIS